MGPPRSIRKASSQERDFRWWQGWSYPTPATFNSEKLGESESLPYCRRQLAPGCYKGRKRPPSWNSKLDQHCGHQISSEKIKTSQSVGRNLSHTKSDWAAALNIRETAADLQTSIGLVRDKRLAITPSGIKDKSPSSSPSVSILLSYSIASFALGPQAIRGLFFSFFFFFLV